MSFPLFIVNKYIRSQNFSFLLSLVSIITITGIALGVIVVTLALSILDGFDSVISEKIVDFNSHIIVSSYGERNISENKDIEKQILTANNKISSVSKFILKSSIIKSKKISEGVLVFGIDPFNNNLGIDKIILHGKYFDSESNQNQILIGRKLAEKLQVSIGTKITLFTLLNDKLPSYANPPVISQFNIVGIYESGMPEYDDLKAYISLSKAKNIFNMNSEISGYNVRLNNLSNIDEIAENLKDIMRYPYFVRTIFDQHQNIFTWIDLQKKPIPIVLGLIVLVAVFNIVGTVLMNILERTSQIGILKSMGASRKQILKIFLIQGIYLGIIGISLGIFFSLLLSELQLKFNIIELPESVYFLNSAPIEINLTNYLVVSVVALLLTIVSSLIPSIIASKIEPIKAIRFD
ncbi:MAG: ABC transporter permease [Bacteroidetes bacterium]|nr:ABC transporter permease [Bacteroidota bacterium]MBU1115368.1 ABC transporter permease [Bacteroidota bacterium]MBU1799495.1 ABC transporter permease [Bacteroidota bacterium]